MANNKIYRFEASAYVDVIAENPEEARELLITMHGHPRAFTINEDDGKIFAFVAPSCNRPTERPND